MRGMSIDFFPRKSVFIILFLISGCASYVNTVKVDEATAAKLRSEVTIYDSKKMSGIEYEAVQNIQATACASRENAMDQLRYIARSVGANGITKIKCGSLLGPSLMQNCLTTVMCEAVAIKVRTSKAEGEKVTTEKVEEPEKKRIISQGEGFTLGKLPLVVTSYDAVGEAKDVEIIFSGNYMAKGKIIKRDKENNLALITFEEFRREPVGFRIFPSYKIKPGQDIYVIGYSAAAQPGGKPGISKGVVSATEGPGGDSRYFGIIAQGDLSNAGSPLLDARGRVIGVVVASSNKTSSTDGKGPVSAETYFALKSNVLLNLFPQMEDFLTYDSEPSLSAGEIFETYRDSVVTVIAK